MEIDTIILRTSCPKRAEQLHQLCGTTFFLCLFQSSGPRAAGAERRALRLRKACRVTAPSTIQTRSITAVEASTAAGPSAGGAPASAGASPSSAATSAGGRPSGLRVTGLVPTVKAGPSLCPPSSLLLLARPISEASLVLLDRSGSN